MNTYVKTACIAALALAMTTFGASQARAGGWAVAGGVVGGVAVGTAIGVSVANAAGPAYYSYPAPVYAAPAPVVTVAAPAYPYYYGPRVACAAPYAYGYGRPWGGAHYGFGPRYFRGGYHYRR